MGKESDEEGARPDGSEEATNADVDGSENG